MEDAPSAEPGAAPVRDDSEDEDIEEMIYLFIQARLKEFWEQGFMILRSTIPLSIINDTLSKIIAADAANSPHSGSRSLQFNNIFKEVGVSFDNKRQQAPLSQAYRELKNSGKALAKQFHMRWQPKQWVVLKSLPNGDEQDPHFDYTKFEINNAQKKYPQTIQAGMMIGLMENSKLIVYRGCFSEADPLKRMELTFGPGDCIIFRGDLVHCGAAFNMMNYRIHCMLLVKGIDWQQDLTELATSPKFKCDFCAYMASTRLKVRNHRKSCVGNPRHRELAERDRARNEQGRMCEICNVFFPKRNSFYKHRQRRHAGVAV